MLKNITLLTSLLLLGMAANAQKFLWGKQYSDILQYSSMVAKDHYLYATGTRILMTKTGPDGNRVWTKKISDYLYGTYIADDGQGHLIVSGFFNGGITVPTNSGDVKLQSSLGDIFITKMDTAGNIIWIKQSKSNDGAYVKAMIADRNGNCYVAATFDKAITLDTKTYNSYGNADFVVTRINADGSTAWSWQGGGPQNDAVNAMLISANNRLIITGSYIGSARLAGTNTDNTGTTSGYIAEADPATGAIWKLKCNGSYLYDFLVPMKTQAGYAGMALYHKTLSYNGNMLTSTTDVGAAVTSCDTAFNIQTAFNIYIVPQVMLVAPNGSVLLSGQFETSMQVDDKTAYTSNGESDVYFMNFDLSGKTLWAAHVGGPNIDEIGAITPDDDGNSLYVSATVQSGPVQFGNVTIPGDFSGAGCLLKMTAPGAGIGHENSINDLAAIYPAPAHESLHIFIRAEMGTHTSAKLMDMQGRKAAEMPVHTGDNILNISGISPGIYLLHIDDGETVRCGKVIIQ